jgi:hemoglobin-like flavoprotein
MTAEQVYLVRKSFAEIARQEHISALVFYRRLFELDPALRPMFTGQIEEQAKKLTEMLGVLIAMLESPVGLELELRAMGARHAGYGVKDEHYSTVGRALIEMIAAVLDKQYSPEIEQAWLTLYGVVETKMKEGAAEAVAQASQKTGSRTVN